MDGMSLTNYLRTKQTQNYVEQHHAFKNKDSDAENQKAIVKFARDLFMSWDDDGSGILEAEEIVKPLVALGLSSDKGFALKILAALDPRSKAEKATSELRIMLADFIKIFKTDKVSEALVNCINKETEKIEAKKKAEEALMTPRTQGKIGTSLLRKMTMLKEKSEDGLNDREDTKVKSGLGLLIKTAQEKLDGTKSPPESQRSGKINTSKSKFSRGPMNAKASF